MSLTKLSLGGNNDVIHKLFLPRESLVSDIPAGDGNIAYSVHFTPFKADATISLRTREKKEKSRAQSCIDNDES